MKTLQLSDIDIYSIGTTKQIAGIVWVGDGISFITEVPGKDEDFTSLQKMSLTLEEWTTLNRQADLLETEILQQDATGITKIILRKSQRQLDNFMQWSIFARDFYMCQYCGRINTEKHPLPLTLDHAPIPWELGGPSIPMNLVTACKSCNKNKGRLSFQEWLDSTYYKKVSKNLPDEILQANKNKLKDIPNIPLVKHIRSR